MPHRALKPLTPQSGMPLLKSKETLVVALNTVDRFLQFMEPSHHRLVMRLNELKKAVDKPAEINRVLVSRLNEETIAQWAKGGPSVDLLLPLVGEDWYREAVKKYLDAKAAVPAVRNPATKQELRMWIAAFQRLVAADGAIIGKFQRLQRDVAAALDAVPADSADKNADNKPKLRRPIPRSKDVVRLAQKIGDELTAETSQRDIAIQFTNGNVRRAVSLLRQLRRYPHLVPRGRK
jgi:hypothetical protein